MWRSQEKSLQIPPFLPPLTSVPPRWNPARVLACSGKQDLWWSGSRGQQPPARWEQWRAAGRGLWEGKGQRKDYTSFPPPTRISIPSVSPVFCRKSFINKLSSIYNRYEFARCPQPLAASGTLLVTSGVMWVSLSFSAFTCLCKPWPWSSKGLTMDIALSMISPYGIYGHTKS